MDGSTAAYGPDDGVTAEWYIIVWLKVAVRMLSCGPTSQQHCPTMRCTTSGMQTHEKRARGGETLLQYITRQPYILRASRIKSLGGKPIQDRCMVCLHICVLHAPSPQLRPLTSCAGWAKPAHPKRKESSSNLRMDTETNNILQPCSAW